MPSLGKKIISFFYKKWKGPKKQTQKKEPEEDVSYEGIDVFCPICKSNFRIFAPFGLKPRQNARCLSCNSLERHRLLWLYLNQKTNIFDGRKIKLLHFAPERVFYDVFSEDGNFEYHPCDLFPDGFNYGGKVKVVKADITDIPFEDDTFDVILCNHVLEHIPDDRKAMKELKRVLKPGGWGIFQVPLDYKRETTYEDFSITTFEGREKAFGQKDHVRWYGKDYKDRLASVGFVVNEDNYIENFSPAEIKKYGLVPQELIYHCQA